MEQPPPKPSAKLRAGIILGGLVLLAIWGATLPSAVRAIRDPRGDAFELIPAFWATITALPLVALEILHRLLGGD